MGGDKTPLDQAQAPESLPNAGRLSYHGAMIVREATVQDVPAVLPMVAKICAFHEKLDPDKYGFLPNPAEMYRDWLRQRATDARSVFLVADASLPAMAQATDESNNPERPLQPAGAPRLAGFLVGTAEREIPIYRLREFGFIHDLWVEADYRNEGLGRQLVTLAIERFREMGMKQIRLDVLTNNPAAQALFTTCGFRPGIVEMLQGL